MSYAIARIRKLKQDNLAGSWSHVARTRTTANANTDVANRRLIGELGADLNSLVTAKIESSPQRRKIRPDAVYSVEILLTASPSYFRPDDPSEFGQYEGERLEHWVQANLQWLKQEYGDRIVLSELHLDEATPHLHAFLVPIDKRGQLNCRAIFGERHALRKFQDRYHAAVAHLGLERGIQGSQANHQDIRDFYQIVNQGRDLSAEVSTEILRAKAADRDRAMTQRNEMEQTAKLQQQRIQELEAENSRYRAEVGVWKRKYQDQVSVSELRRLPLEQVAHELGLNQDATDRQKWSDGTHYLSINGSKFYTFRGNRGGGGAIDLVMQVQQCDYKQAVVWLKEHFGEAAALRVATDCFKETFEEDAAQPFEPPMEDAEKWQAVRTYLTSTRGIPSKFVDFIHDQGLLYADSKQNAVFIRRSFDGQVITGASLRGTYGENNEFIGLAKGSKRNGGWFYLEDGTGDEVKRVVLVESPIEALSCWSLHSYQNRNEQGKTLYMATDGISPQLLDTIRDIPIVVAAFNNNDAGEGMAQQVQESISHTTRYMPEGKDWNEDLVTQLQTFLEKMQQRPQQPPKKKATRKRNRDIEL